MKNYRTTITLQEQKPLKLPFGKYQLKDRGGWRRKDIYETYLRSLERIITANPKDFQGIGLREVLTP